MTGGLSFPSVVQRDSQRGPEVPYILVAIPSVVQRYHLYYYSPLSAPGANCVPGANTHLRQLLFRRFCRLETFSNPFTIYCLYVKVKIIFFNLLKTRTKSESLFIFILELQRKKRAGARQNLREILLFQREFHNEGISN